MKNVGKIDRIIRVALGAVLILAAVILQITAGRFWWLGLPGLVFAGTGFISYCPLYVPLKINTGRKQK